MPCFAWQASGERKCDYGRSIGIYERFGYDINRIRAIFHRFKCGRDILCAVDFERGNLQAKGAGRDLDRRHFERRDGTTANGQDRQSTRTGHDRAQ